MEFLKIKIDKSFQFTDWSKRPLSKLQIDYASNDVNYLCDVYEHQKKLLNELNDEQIKIISDTINPAHWKARFKKQPDDYAFVKEVLVQAGIE